jgi:predicted Co/Zn/Cd cation transporter (cation efflux family)
MTLVAMLLGIVFGLVFSIMLIVAGIYSLLVHIVPPEELRLFIREIRTALRRNNRKRNSPKK